MKEYKSGHAGYLFNILVGLFLILTAIACMYPMLYTIFASFSDPKLLMMHTGLLFSSLGFTLEGYGIALSYAGIKTGYINTIFIVTVGTAISMLLTTFGAYGLSRKGMLLRKPLMLLITFTMFFSGGLIPSYLTVKGLGLIDSLFALIFPVAINTINLIILRTSISAMPPSVEESAKIDGANDFLILFRIVLPLVGPTLAVLTLYYIVGQWNSWFTAMLYIKDHEKYPLQLILREIVIANTGGNTAQAKGMNMKDLDIYKQLVKYCTIVIATVPILCVYPFLQKYFVNGVMLGSIKE